jgi:hypothetical protein
MTLEFLVQSILIGILASYTLLAVALWSHNLGLPRLDFSRAMANLTYGEQFDGNPPYWPGTLVIYFNGVIFALLFTYYVGQYLPGDAIFRGALWGLILWFFSGIFFVPVILREGVFLSHIHPMAWLTSLIVHGMYGGVVGLFAPIRGYVEPANFFGL